jgi:Rieske Fe-S protein
MYIAKLNKKNKNTARRKLCSNKIPLSKMEVLATYSATCSGVGCTPPLLSTLTHYVIF